MKITEKELRRLIRENMAMRMTQDRMRKSGGGSFSEPRAKGSAQKRKGNEPITRNHIVKNSFKGTSSDRAKLNKELKAQIEKMIAAGKEDQIPSNWNDILGLSNGDQLLALKQAINPGVFKKVGRFLGLSESVGSEAEILFGEFDDLGNKLKTMSTSDPGYERVSDAYDAMEEDLRALGYKITSSFNPFSVDGGKIKDMKTGEVVHSRRK